MTTGVLGREEASRARFIRRGRRLEYLTVGWNVVEAVLSIGAGLAAGSVALVGFGVDSVIESIAGVAMLWRLRDGESGERREPVALRIVSGSLILLALYVAYEAAESLYARRPPEASYVGIIVAGASLAGMPLLARAKRRVARALGSRAMEADSRQTDLCAYLSAILLAGLALNALFGWWWADPVAGLVMSPFIAKEGVDALRGEKRCDDC